MVFAAWESLIEAHFQFYKVLGIVASVGLIIAFQLIFPNRLAFQKMLQNWSINIPVAFFNMGLMSVLCGACVCTWAVTVREHGIGFMSVVQFPYWAETLLTVLILDFVAWIWHIANHRWAFLWRFHTIHHSDSRFETSTAFRFHAGELVISLGVRLAVVTLTGLPLLGLILFEVLYGFFNALVHSDIRIPARMERWLGWCFVTPSLHRLHHSVQPTEYNRNFGTIFSWWDRFARTYSYANADTWIEIGLMETNWRKLSIVDLLRLPFRGTRGR